MEVKERKSLRSGTERKKMKMGDNRLEDEVEWKPDKSSERCDGEKPRQNTLKEVEVIRETTGIERHKFLDRKSPSLRDFRVDR